MQITMLTITPLKIIFILVSLGEKILEAVAVSNHSWSPVDKALVEF